MIYVDRASVPQPKRFATRARAAHKILADFIKRTKRDISQRKLPFDDRFLTTDKELNAAMRLLFQDRCAFCETPLTPSRQLIARFRPRERAAQLDGKVSPLHYWWRAYDWNNFFLACLECLTSRGQRFPVKGRRAAQPRVGQGSTDGERALLLDPCRDNPETELQFLEDGTVQSDTERGRTTIDVFGLNRISLVDARRDYCERVDRIGNAFLFNNQPELWTERNFIDVVFDEVPSDWGYRALIRQQARRYLLRSQQESGQGPTITSRGPKEARPYEGAIWLRRIYIENFKALKSVDLQFPTVTAQSAGVEGAVQSALRIPTTEPWLMLLGENGVGKSSVLKAIALALMPTRVRRKHAKDGRDWVRDGATTGLIRLEFTVGADALELHFSRKDAQIVRRGDYPNMSVLGYGSTRLLPHASAKRARPQRIRLDNLFDGRAPLHDAERWLGSPRQVKSADFNLLATSLKTLLALDADDRIARRKRRLWATLFDRRTAIRQLSDGYQSVLALATDMMLNLSKATFDMEGVEGVVLVDELEVHLHPRWKIAIVGALRQLFPRVRFIVTTHDPLCVQGINKGELHIMTRQGADHTVTVDQFDVPAGLRADQILTGAWFGVPSTRDPDTVAMMREHSALLQSENRTADKETRLVALDRELRHRLDDYVGTTNEQIALKVAADVHAEQRQRSGKAAEVSAEELRDKIREALNSQAPGVAGV